LLYICLSVFWQIDQKNHKKLDTLFEDIQISMQLDKYAAWQEDSRNEQATRPINADGREVNHSTYSRTAWFVKGIDLLQENPLGSGFSHLAFRHYILQENPYSRIIMTHSGWLDYALGLGIPGLTLTWLAMFLVMSRAYRLTKNIMNQPPLNAYLALWIVSGLWILWWPSELSEREFIEQLFFIVALFATATVQYRFINSIPSK
jgi:O-antigen ligase